MKNKKINMVKRYCAVLNCTNGQTSSNIKKSLFKAPKVSFKSL